VKLLLDENVSDRIVQQIVDLFPDSTHVKATGLKEADDSVVWGWEKQHRFTILSKGGDPNALLQRILTNGIHDGPLEGFLNVRQNTARSLEDPQLNPDFVDVFNGIITDMDSKIKQRLDGYLLGLQAQASSIQDQLEELQRNSGNGRLRLVSDLEHAVRDAEERVGGSE
jgi:hypothetical protein